MKKYILPLAICSTVLLLNCEKEATVDPFPDDALYDVNLSVTGFTQRVEEMSKLQASKTMSAQESDDAVQTYLEVLDYFLYDESGELINHRMQEKEGALPPHAYFGETSYQLPLGTYKLIVVGSTGGVSYSDSSQYSSTYLMPFGDDYPPAVDDIFYKEIEFTVDGEQDVNETVHLKRIVGSLEVNLTESITDLWAGNIPDVRVWTVTKYPFDKDQEAEVSEGPEYLLPHISGEHEPWTTVDFVYRGFVLPDRSGDFDIQPWILIRGERSNTIASRSFEDIILEPNKKWIISGSLTGPYKNQHFTVTADSTWEGTDVIEFEGEL